MKGWNQSEHIDFDFYNAHDIRPLTDRALDETVKKRLREHLGNTKQSIALIGGNTRNLYKFVRWEIEMCLKLDIPIIAVNLNGSRRMDPGRCPPILRGQYVAHVSFKAKIIQYALDNFTGEFGRREANAIGDRYFEDDVYRKLGI